MDYTNDGIMIIKTDDETSYSKKYLSVITPEISNFADAYEI